MHRPLLQGGLLDFAADSFPDAEIVSRRVEGDTHRETYAEARERVTQLSFALDALGVQMGDRAPRWHGTAIAILSFITPFQASVPFVTRLIRAFRPSR
ncbi:hypothetical protein [Paracoccus amoyensis]|uniref:hypothetical protein n=1 Tax=Paracoccus amoyensis TaxID=2760093 RepID=UPI0031B58B94